MKNLTFALAIVGSFAGSYAATSMLNASESPAVSLEVPRLPAPVLSLTANNLKDQTFQVADLDNVLRFEGDDVSAIISPDVSLEVQSSTVVKKIEGGRVSSVQIVSTPTGTYSTDGLASPHVHYHGIEIAEQDKIFSAFAWVSGFGWAGVPLNGTLTYINTGTVRILQNGTSKFTCIKGTDARVCY